MVRVVTVSDICQLVQKVGIKFFFDQVLKQMKEDFSHWESFTKRPRVATQVKPSGVIELMPISNEETYTFKFVNGHPQNTQINKLTVAAFGALASMKNGYPSLISEMTLLTAIRTAATSALASTYLARKGVSCFGIIGTGAQSEFQVLAHHFALGINQIYYFDTDNTAMEKFERNLADYDLILKRCDNAESVTQQSQIITTATANKGHNRIIEKDWLQIGAHVNAIGGDSPGKTEISKDLLDKSKIVVEYTPQTQVEGEIQRSDKITIYAELWEIICGKKTGRESNEEITLFDSVGFAIEDYSVLKVVEGLAEQHQVGHLLDIVPEVDDPKNLFSLLRNVY